MKKYALLLLLVLGLSTSAWGYVFTPPLGTPWIIGSPWLGIPHLTPSLNPGIGLMGNLMVTGPSLWGGPTWQSSYTYLNLDGLNVFQGQIASQVGSIQSTLNVQVYKNSVQVVGPPQDGGQP